MRIRFLDWRRGWQRLADRMRMLERLFAQLLIREEGDVERALELMRRASERYGLFDEDLTFEDFKKALLEGKFIRLRPEILKNKDGRLLYLNGELLEIIKRAEMRRRPEGVYVFHRDGKRIGDFRKTWKTACKTAGLFLRHAEA